MTWSESMRAALGAHAAWVVPDWPAPPRVRAFVTTRQDGVSRNEYATLNLGSHSGDDPAHVARNREIVRECLPATPRWMAQTHGTAVADLDTAGEGDAPRADAAAASVAGRVAVVLTADCMPLLLCDRSGRRVAIAHAGWRGMAAGVIENAVGALHAAPGEAIAWLGPTIGPTAFEVGAEVRAAFVATDPAAADAFKPHASGKFMADLYGLARQRLRRAGVARVFGGDFCTYREVDRFFSYRREKRSGRMGAFIWLE